MKKVISLFMAFVMLLSVTSGISVTAFAANSNPTGKCGENITWKYNNTTKTLTLSGIGDTPSFSSYDTDRPWDEYEDDIENIKIEEGITSIGDYLFAYCRHDSVEIPKTITLIGEFAFGDTGFENVIYNGTNSEFFNIKNIEKDKKLIMCKFEPVLKNDVFSKPLDVDYKQSEYLELSNEDLFKIATDRINNDATAKANNIRVNDGYLYINDINIGKISGEYDYFPNEYAGWDLENDFSEINPTVENIEKLHSFYLDVRSLDNELIGNIGIDLSFLNDSDYNKADEKYVADFIKTLDITKPYYFEVDYEDYMKEFIKAKNEETQESFNLFWKYCHKIASRYYNEQIKDDSIKVVVGSGAGGTEGSLNAYYYESGSCLAVFKNDVLYGVYAPEYHYYIDNNGCKIHYNEPFIPVIVLPDNLSDNEIKNYLMKKINSDWQNNDINNIKKGAKIEDRIEIENGYTLKSKDFEDSIIIAKRSSNYTPDPTPTPGGGSSGGSIGGGGGGAPAPEAPTETPATSEKPDTTPAPTSNKPATVKATGTKAKSKALAVYWNKLTGVDGYQIQVATDKNFKKNKKTVTVAKQNASKKTVKNLKKNKKYYVRVRSYKIVNGKKVYGKWSKVKSVKTK